MHYLTQPRGLGTGWVFRKTTPSELAGVPNPWDGKPLQKEIKRGLSARQLVNARVARDIMLGDICRLEQGLTDHATFSLVAALDLKEDIVAARRNPRHSREVEGIAHVIADKIEAAQRRGVSSKQLSSFSRVATGKGFPLVLAHAQYVEERSVGNRRGYYSL